MPDSTPTPPPPTSATLPPWSGPAPAAPPPRSVSFDSLAFLAKVVGILLVFVGALVIVILVTPQAACVTATTTSCNTTYLQNAYNGLFAGRILLVIGFGGLVLGSGIRLRYSLTATSAVGPEEVRRWATGRWGNLLLLLVAMSLTILVVITTVTPSVSVTFP